jgi:thioredoxin reductase (NADPH)
VTDQRQPAIVLVSETRADFLLDEFGRYARDYDLRTATSAAEAEAISKELTDAGAQVALYVSESRLPDAHVLAAFNSWRAVVPTARRRIAAHWETFREDAEALRRAAYATRSSTTRSPRCSRTGARRWLSPRWRRCASSPPTSTR